MPPWNSNSLLGGETRDCHDHHSRSRHQQPGTHHTHQGCSPTHSRPSPICMQIQQVNGQCYFNALLTWNSKQHMHDCCLWITAPPLDVGLQHNTTPFCHSAQELHRAVLSPFLYSLYTYGCIVAHNINAIIKSADDTTVVGLITDGDESANRKEVQRLTDGCIENNLAHHTKTHHWFQ